MMRLNQKTWIGKKMTVFLGWSLVALFMFLPSLYTLALAPASRVKAADCGNDTIFGIDSWTKYLECEVDGSGSTTVKFEFPGDIWLIVAAALDIILTLVVYASVAAVMWGAFNIATANGEPEKIKKGRQTITNALIGLGIAIIAGRIVHYIAGLF